MSREKTTFYYVLVGQEVEERHLGIALKDIGPTFPRLTFYKVHKSHYVNPDHVKKLIPLSGGRYYRVMLTQGETPGSKKYLDDYPAWMEKKLNSR